MAENATRQLGQDNTNEADMEGQRGEVGNIHANEDLEKVFKELGHDLPRWMLVQVAQRTEDMDVWTAECIARASARVPQQK